MLKYIITRKIFNILNVQHAIMINIYFKINNTAEYYYMYLHFDIYCNKL